MKRTFWASSDLLINHIIICAHLWGCLPEFIIISAGGRMLCELSRCLICLVGLLGLCLHGDAGTKTTNYQVYSRRSSIRQCAQTTETTSKALNHKTRLVTRVENSWGQTTAVTVSLQPKWRKMLLIQAAGCKHWYSTHLQWSHPVNHRCGSLLHSNKTKHNKK